jgi:ATP-dependent Clp protease ATP-binding subunit ClpA
MKAGPTAPNRSPTSPGNRHARGHDHIRPEHYLIALLDAGRGAGDLPSVALLVLEALDVSVDDLRQRINDALGDSRWPHKHGVPTTPEVWRALKAARVEGDLMGHQHIGTEHLLLGIAIEGTGLAAQVLNELGATPDRLRESSYSVLTMHAHGRPPESEDTTRHVTLPTEIRDLDEKIAELRRHKEQAIDAGAYQAAATLRDEEKQLLARRATAVRIWAPQVDAARIVREVEYLRAEVQRLTRLLARHGIDAERTSTSGVLEPKHPNRLDNGCCSSAARWPRKPAWCWRRFWWQVGWRTAATSAGPARMGRVPGLR